MLMHLTDEITFLLNALLVGAVGLTIVSVPFAFVVYYCYRRERNKRVRKYHRRRREKETLIEDDV